MASLHKPVLLKEVIEFLNPQPGQNFVDCTFGGGGHSRAILEKIKPDGKLLAIDADKNVMAIKNKNFKLVIDNFRNLKKIVECEKEFLTPPNPPFVSGGIKDMSLVKGGIRVHGILLDLGLSSDQLEKSGRGFSFQKDEPLDMRFDVNQELTAAHILNFYSVEKLNDIFKNYGEYPHARQLAGLICHPEAPQGLKDPVPYKNKHGSRIRFRTTQDLVDVILSVHKRRHYEKIHPATKVFQALRIAVNNELENLKEVLPQAVEILVPSGRLAVISFHGLEDRIVKVYFRDLARAEKPSREFGIKLLTKKPVSPSDEEIKENSRSRSAKMRVAEKI